MPDQSAVYERIQADNFPALKAGDVFVDEALVHPAGDFRRGVGLLIPVRTGRGAYASLVESFREDPPQYLYPFGDLHVTLFSLVSGRVDYVRNQETNETFGKIAQKVLGGFPPFTIEFRGVAFSQEAGLIRGFDSGELVALRRRFREELKAGGLANTERYQSLTAHATFLRFVHPPRNPGFTQKILEQKEVPFGVETVDTVELVEHDWYNREKNRTGLRTFRLSRAAGNL